MIHTTKSLGQVTEHPSCAPYNASSISFTKLQRANLVFILLQKPNWELWKTLFFSRLFTSWSYFFKYLITEIPAFSYSYQILNFSHKFGLLQPVWVCRGKLQFLSIRKLLFSKEGLNKKHPLLTLWRVYCLIQQFFTFNDLVVLETCVSEASVSVKSIKPITENFLT